MEPVFHGKEKYFQSAQYSKANREREHSLCVAKFCCIPAPIAQTFPLSHFWKKTVDAGERHYCGTPHKPVFIFCVKVK